MSASAAKSRSVAVVLLDANVLYSHVLSDYFTSAYAQGLIEIKWSSAILDEMITNTKALALRKSSTVEEKLRRVETADQLRRYIDRQYPEAVVTTTSEHFEAFADVPMRDPDDRHVVAAAVAAEADLLCTANVRDFPEVLMDRVGIQSVTPDRLLVQLIEDQPARMIRAHQQTIEWTPGTTHRATLDVLRRAGAPHAADRMEALLSPLGVLDARDDLAEIYAQAIESARLARAGFVGAPTRATRAGSGRQRHGSDCDPLRLR